MHGQQNIKKECIMVTKVRQYVSCITESYMIRKTHLQNLRPYVHLVPAEHA